MGAGGDGRPARDNFIKRSFSIEKLKGLGFAGVKDDLTVLRHMWFGKAWTSSKADDHAARLEKFYGPQAKACEYARMANCTS